MPRKNLSSRTTKKTCSNSYDHTVDYTSCKSEKVYTSKDSLILWTDFCSAPSSATKGLLGNAYQQIAVDRSKDATDLVVYAPNNQLTTLSTITVSETNLMNLFANSQGQNVDIVTPESLNMCGDPCYWMNVSTGQPEKGDTCNGKANGPNHLFIQNNSALNFGDASEDSPFSISIWYYPIDYVDNPNSLYDKGGTTKGQAPAIFHKTFQYALYQRECGKLEFTLYDVNLTASSTTQISGDTLYDFTGTSATMSIRSDEYVLNPAQWNHITVTYDGSGTREGMQIYVNCEQRTNREDDPPEYSGSLRTQSVDDAALIDAEAAFQAFLNSLYFSGTSDQENISQYTAMHAYDTPLMFATTALPVDVTSITSLSHITMSTFSGTQLPFAFMFDIAIWSSALSEENVKSVCDATRNCILQYSDDFGRDSGYINLSPKIMKNILDESDNSLSVIDRIGDRSDRRVKNRQPYNDELSINFGKRITDEMKAANFRFSAASLSDLEINYSIPSAGIIPDSNLWETKNAFIKREEKVGNAAQPIYDSALSLSSATQSTPAYIATVSNVNNAIIYYDLILGPHNTKPGYLNLKPPLRGGSAITVSISTDEGATYKVVKTHSATGSFGEYQQNFYNTPGIVLQPRQHNFRKSFKLDFNDINSDGLPYRIKFETSDNCWGIGRIDIISSEEEVRYPILINHDSVIGKKIDSDFIATPHTRSDLSTINKSIKGITDKYILFSDTKTQKLLPYNDNESINFASNNFFNHGVSNEYYPGFSGPLKDKTHFVMTLDAISETDIGLTYKTGGVDEIGGAGEAEDTANQIIGHPINAAWNNKDKKWQALPYGFRPIYEANSLDSGIRTTNRVGFSSIDMIASGSKNIDASDYSGDYIQHGPEVLSSYAQPISSFGFPIHSSFTLPTADIDGLISMSDYITKPFALEKIVVEFDARFEFAGSDTESATGARHGHRLLYASSSIDKPSTRVSDNHAVLIPSFYLLNVKQNATKLFSHNYIIDDTVLLNRNPNGLTFTGSIESTAQYDTQGRNFTACEMISYGQMTMFMSGASDTLIDINKALEDGLGRDSIYDIRELNGQTGDDWINDGINPITSSFKIEFPVRNAPKTDFTSRTYYKTTDGNFFSIMTGNDTGGRGTTVITGSDRSQEKHIPNFSARGVINNISAIDAKDKLTFLLPDTNSDEDPYAVSSSGFLIDNEKTSVSPYILFPKDKLSINFSYPVPQRGIFAHPGSTDTRLNKMTLLGKTRVHLFGSAIKNGKEFHENMNQALTTKAITEPIGCEAVVDQFNIHNKDEYYKTYVDRDPLLFTTASLLGNNHSWLLSAKNLTAKGNPKLQADIRRHTGYQKLKPADRLKLINGSLVNKWASYNEASTQFLKNMLLLYYSL